VNERLGKGAARDTCQLCVYECWAGEGMKYEIRDGSNATATRYIHWKQNPFSKVKGDSEALRGDDDRV